MAVTTGSDTTPKGSPNQEGDNEALMTDITSAENEAVASIIDVMYTLEQFGVVAALLQQGLDNLTGMMFEINSQQISAIEAIQKAHIAAISNSGLETDGIIGVVTAHQRAISNRSDFGLIGVTDAHQDALKAIKTAQEDAIKAIKAARPEMGINPHLDDKPLPGQVALSEY